MTAGAKQVTEAALKLPEQDRLQVASAIWKSMGGTDEHLADLAALARAQDFETGKVTPKSQAEVFQKARTVLGSLLNYQRPMAGLSRISVH